MITFKRVYVTSCLKKKSFFTSFRTPKCRRCQFCNKNGGSGFHHVSQSIYLHLRWSYYARGWYLELMSPNRARETASSQIQRRPLFVRHFWFIMKDTQRSHGSYYIEIEIFLLFAVKLYYLQRIEIFLRYCILLYTVSFSIFFSLRSWFANENVFWFNISLQYVRIYEDIL